jgi:hypothetical protein
MQGALCRFRFFRAADSALSRAPFSSILIADP